MRRLGKAIHLSKNGKLILKLEPDSETPTIGERTFDSNLSPVGAVEDIFGPVGSPYIAIKPEIKTVAILIDNTLYAMKVRSIK